MLSLQYISGFFDGEGCVGIYSSTCKRGFSRTQLRVYIGNTSLSVLQSIHAEYGGSIGVRKGVNMPVHTWRLNGKAAATFIEKILPFSIIKRDQLLVAMEYYKFVTEFEKEDRYETIYTSGAFGGGTYRKRPEVVEKELAYALTIKSLKTHPVLSEAQD